MDSSLRFPFNYYLPLHTLQRADIITDTYVIWLVTYTFFVSSSSAFTFCFCCLQSFLWLEKSLGKKGDGWSASMIEFECVRKSSIPFLHIWDTLAELSSRRAELLTLTLLIYSILVVWCGYAFEVYNNSNKNGSKRLYKFVN